MDNSENSHYLFESIARGDLIGLKTTLKIFPYLVESVDRCLNTPLLYACYCGRNRIVEYLLRLGANHECLNIFGQNALTLATYSGDLDTCYAILNRINFAELNTTGILTPLCVAALQGNVDIANFFLTLEIPKQNLSDCPSESIHGICPLQLAQMKGDTNMIELLRPSHQMHLLKPQTN